MKKIKDKTVDAWIDSMDALKAAQDAVRLAEEAIIAEIGDADKADSKIGMIGRVKKYDVDEAHLRSTFVAVHTQCAAERESVAVLEPVDKKEITEDAD